MSRLIKNEIASIIKQSDDIAKHVHLENWDSVEQLTLDRQTDLDEFFKDPVSPKDAGAVEKMIRSILDADQTLVEFIQLEKKKTFNKFANLKNNNKAKQTYQNVASLDYR